MMTRMIKNGWQLKLKKHIKKDNTTIKKMDLSYSSNIIIINRLSPKMTTFRTIPINTLINGNDANEKRNIIIKIWYIFDVIV